MDWQTACRLSTNNNAVRDHGKLTMVRFIDQVWTYDPGNLDEQCVVRPLEYGDGYKDWIPATPIIPKYIPTGQIKRYIKAMERKY